MDAISQKAYQTLTNETLPKLNIELPKLETSSDLGQLAFLMEESIELMKLLLKAISTGGAETDISDEEARMLLADMDSPTESQDTSDISDEEAKMLLADMDSPTASPTDEEADISDEEAKMLLADMDAPTGNQETSDISDEEAKMLLENMDAPTEEASDIPDKTNEAQEEETNLEQTPQKVEEIPEFGESEFGSDPDMIKDFLNNTGELMEILDDQILQLEQTPDDKEVIEEIFRAAHTLKGAAGMFAYNAIERVMHRMEDFFDKVRKGKLSATSDSIDTILEGIDVIRTLIEAVREGQPSGIKTAPIVVKLDQICSGKKATPTNNDEEKAETETKATQGKKEEQKKEVENAPSKESGKKRSATKTEQSTIRVDLQRLDALVNLVGELVIDRTRFISIEEDLTKDNHDQLSSNMSETVQLFGRHMNEIQDIIMKVRMVPIGNAFNKFHRVIRDLAKGLGKEIELIIHGEATELDKTLVEKIGDPLIHLIRNSVDHGIEMPEKRIENGKSSKGLVQISARQEGNQIIINIEDDGGGINADVIRKKAIEKDVIGEEDVLSEREIFNLIFEPGFSTAEQVTNISGRGVGMDVVKKQISKLKGIIDITSKINKGTTITIQLPLTLAIVQSLLVQTSDDVFAIPLSSVVESIRISPSEIQRVGEAEVIKRRDMALPLIYLKEALCLEKKDQQCWYSEKKEVKTNWNHNSEERLFVVVVGTAESRFGIVVDTLLNQQEMVIKPLGNMMVDIPCVAGGSILGNGEVVLVLDIAEVEALLRKSRYNQQAA